MRYKCAMFGLGDEFLHVCNSKLDLLRGLAAQDCLEFWRCQVHLARSVDQKYNALLSIPLSN